MAKRLKAYLVSCRDEDHGAKVVFAHRAREVDKLINSELCDCHLLQRQVRRAPRFDKYNGAVTVANYLAEGWEWNCSQCGHRLIDEDQPLIDEQSQHVVCGILCATRGAEKYVTINEPHQSVKDFQAAMDRIITAYRAKEQHGT